LVWNMRNPPPAINVSPAYAGATADK
jgi:hypothetical protein